MKKYPKRFLPLLLAACSLNPDADHTFVEQLQLQGAPYLRQADQSGELDRIFLKIQQGDEFLIQSASTIQKQVDASLSLGLRYSLSKGLIQNPDAVMQLIPSVYAVDDLCTIPYIEGEAYVWSWHVQRSLEALESSSLSDQPTHQACIQKYQEFEASMALDPKVDAGPFFIDQLNKQGRSFLDAASVDGQWAFIASAIEQGDGYLIESAPLINHYATKPLQARLEEALFKAIWQKPSAVTQWLKVALAQEDFCTQNDPECRFLEQLQTHGTLYFEAPASRHLFDAMLLQIESGDESSILASSLVKKYTDYATDAELLTSLSKGMGKNPTAVMALIPETYSVDQLCFRPLYSDTPEADLQGAQEAINALKVAPLGASPLYQTCIHRLEAGGI